MHLFLAKQKLNLKVFLAFFKLDNVYSFQESLKDDFILQKLPPAVEKLSKLVGSQKFIIGDKVGGDGTEVFYFPMLLLSQTKF